MHVDLRSWFGFLIGAVVSSVHLVHVFGAWAQVLICWSTAPGTVCASATLAQRRASPPRQPSPGNCRASCSAPSPSWPLRYGGHHAFIAQEVRRPSCIHGSRGTAAISHSWPQRYGGHLAFMASEVWRPYCLHGPRGTAAILHSWPQRYGGHLTFMVPEVTAAILHSWFQRYDGHLAFMVLEVRRPSCQHGARVMADVLPSWLPSLSFTPHL